MSQIVPAADTGDESAGKFSAVARRDRLTGTLLTCGAAAGPLYALTGLVQILTRPGFDARRHALSLLSNGEFGWVQIGNFR